MHWIASLSASLLSVTHIWLDYIMDLRQEIKQKSLFDSGAVALVNPVNCEGVMGAGLALEFKTRFPSAFVDYHLRCRNKGLVPGELHTYKMLDGRWIINFPTKTLWKQKSKIEYVQAGLPALIDFIKMNAISSIAVPALGCGLGGLSWPHVKREIEAAFNTLPSGTVDLMLFEPQTKFA